MARRSGYETYLGWVDIYGGKAMSEKQYNQARQLLKQELKEQGKSTTNLSRTLAQESSFTYDYTVGRAIKKVYQEQGFGKISISEARNIMQYTAEGKPLRNEINPEFWNHVSAEYKNLKAQGISIAGAKQLISETIFGSP